MCVVLKEVYNKVYGEAFNYSILDNRIKLQKAVYLLENMGVCVGDYSFSWDKYGPYSLALDADAKDCSTTGDQPANFSTLAQGKIDTLKKYVNEDTEYTCVHWVECLASLHYLKHVLKYQGSALLFELKTRKPHLSNDDANQKAFSIIKQIKVGG